jgi:phosphate transport system substrate-binding protein
MTLTARARILTLAAQLIFISSTFSEPSIAQTATVGLVGKVTASGSTTVSPLMAEIAKRLEGTNPGLRIDIQTGGSSRGINDAIKGASDIGMTSRALKDSEKPGVTAIKIAQDGVAMLVHASNPITNLTDAQVLAIYTGSAKNWKDVGGKDAPITVINRAEGRSELELFTEYLKIKSADIKPSLVSGENQHGIKSVANDPNAIIYMSVGASEYAISEGEKLKLVSWNGIEATSKNVANATLPVTRPLILVIKNDAAPLVRTIVDYARSKAVKDLVLGFSYVELQ